MSTHDHHLIWLDLEMTGLDVDNDCIIEIATIITDKNLHEIAEGPAIAIHQTDAVLNGMDSWNTHHHTKTGLVERVKQSPFNVKQAEQQTLDFLRSYVEAGTSPMCGNSICQDRRFIHRFMPELEVFFHYRNLDVSTLKILTQLWRPAIAKDFNKTSKHEALSDIRDSIAELRYYRDKLDLA